jgi:uncharacterized metal-binding protein
MSSRNARSSHRIETIQTIDGALSRCRRACLSSSGLSTAQRRAIMRADGRSVGLQRNG